MTEMSYNPLKSSLKALSYGSSAKNQFNPEDLLLYKFLLVFKTRMLKEKRNFPGCMFYPFTMTEKHCVLQGRPQKDAHATQGEHLSQQWRLEQNAEEFSDMQGPCCHSMKCSVSVQKTKSRQKKKPQNTQVEQLQREMSISISLYYHARLI